MIVSVLGDSISVGHFSDGDFHYDVNASYPMAVAHAIGANEVVLFGFEGATIGKIDVATVPPSTDLLIVNVGTNDLWHVAQGDTTLEATLYAWSVLYSAARQRAPSALVAVIGLRDNSIMRPARFPALHEHVPRFNRYVLTREDIVPVDLDHRDGAHEPDNFPDTIHPSPKGVQWIAQAVIEALARRAVSR